MGKRIMFCAIREYTGCMEIDLEANNRETHWRIIMRVPHMDVAKQPGESIQKIARAHKAGDVDYITRTITKMKRHTRGDISTDPREATSGNNRTSATN